MRDSFYDNGLPRFRGNYVDGKMHGFWEFFRKDGSLMRSGYFDKERQVGVWKTYDCAGNLVKESDYGS